MALRILLSSHRLADTCDAIAMDCMARAKAFLLFTEAESSHPFRRSPYSWCIPSTNCRIATLRLNRQFSFPWNHHKHDTYFNISVLMLASNTSYDKSVTWNAYVRFLSFPFYFNIVKAFKYIFDKWSMYVCTLCMVQADGDLFKLT